MTYTYGTEEWEKAFKDLAEERMKTESKPYIVGSPEWIIAFEKLLQEDQKYKEVAKRWEGSCVIHMLGNAEAGIEEDLYIFMDLWHGDCRSIRLVPKEVGEKGDYLLTAKLERWESVMKGKLNPVKGMMQGKIKLKGNLPTIIRSVKAATRLVELSSQVGSKFPSELNEEEFANMQAMLKDIRPKFGV